MKIGFVTDSTSDIPASLAGQYGIEIVPVLVNINGRSYLDGVEISREEFYSRLPGMRHLPTTSSPSVGSFQQRYEKLFKAGADSILSIHPPNGLSGIYNAARLAAQEFGQRVSVIDSGQLSLGLGYQVILAAEAAAKGAMHEELLSLVEDLRQRVRLTALLETIAYVRRSGRVSWVNAMIGSALRLQPLVGLRLGIVQRFGQARTRLQGIERLVEILNSWGQLERLAVLHTNAEAAASQLLERVKSKVAIPPMLVNVTTVIGTHVGPNGLGFVAVPAS
ncbi:MAG TPA: DegV family protein [Anaerolineales bacterium]|nr:DegV family protein [Anaerolineales bacterium]